MPSMPGFSDDDIRLMRAFVLHHETSESGADWLDGRDLYLASCSTCHGTRGNDIRHEDFGDWREAIREGEDDMPAMPGFSNDDIRQMREYVLDPDRDVQEPDPEPDPDPVPDPDPDPSPVTYDGTVKAILTTSCTSCHRQGLALGSVALDTYATAFANRVALVDSVEKNRMPGSPAVSAAGKTALRDWLDGGALEK